MFRRSDCRWRCVGPCSYRKNFRIKRIESSRICNRSCGCAENIACQPKTGEDATPMAVAKNPFAARNITPLEMFTVRADREFQTMIRLSVRVAVLLCVISTSAFAETCIASHYGYSGGRTASRERMNPNAMTAAHRTKPFGSQVTVTSQSSGRSVTVRINDRGPFIKGRCIDLSTGAARALWMDGIERVTLTEHPALAFTGPL